MSDIRILDQMEWLQEALYYGLRSNDLFDAHNFVLERRFRLDQTVALDAIWQTIRNGASGAGSLIEMPRLLTPLPNSQVNQLRIGVVTFEERNINLTPGTGSLKPAEYWSQLIAEFMRGWMVSQAGGLVPEPTSVAPAEDWIKEDEGIMAYRAAVTQKVSRQIVPRCGTPSLALNGYAVTLANAAVSPDADIYFTTDGSFPGRPAAQAEDVTNTVRYAGPFTVGPGALVQFAAYKRGWFQSNVGAQNII